MATPIVVAGQHVGNVFTGQFFFEDETVDRELFRDQAREVRLRRPAALALPTRSPAEAAPNRRARHGGSSCNRVGTTAL